MAYDLSREEAQAMMTKFGNKESIQAISVATGRDPKTIRKVVTDPTPPTAPPRRARGSKLDPYASYLAERWDQGCHNAQFLWEELRQRGFTDSLSLVRQSVAPRRSQRGVEPTPGFETEPGEHKQCDLADFGALVYPDWPRKLYIFADTMGYSRRMSIEFVHDPRQDTWFQRLEHAFAWFGCVPTQILSDNMTPMVVSHPYDGQVVWNPRFKAFADFHGFRPKAAKPYRARTKGKIERIVSYVRQNFWPRVPDAITLADLNRLVARWAEERDQRIHGTTFAQRADRWAAEAAGATPYDPTHLWVFREPWDRKVTSDAFVHWEGHRFAMPWEAAGHHVAVRRTASGIAIQWDHRVVATYDRPTAA